MTQQVDGLYPCLGFVELTIYQALQSMIICKQPEIGGEGKGFLRSYSSHSLSLIAAVPEHNDS